MASVTKQALFNRVAKHLLTQRRRSANGGACMYRLPYRGEVLMCAVGCLIPNKAYSPEIEGKCASSISKLLPGKRRYAEFLEDLQTIHDSTKPSMWPKALRLFADEHGLDAGVITRLAPNGKWKPLPAVRRAA